MEVNKSLLICMAFVAVIFIILAICLSWRLKKEQQKGAFIGKAIDPNKAFLGKIFYPIDLYENKWDGRNYFKSSYLLKAMIDGQDFMFEVSIAQLQTFIENPGKPCVLQSRALRVGLDEFYFQLASKNVDTILTSERGEVLMA